MLFISLEQIAYNHKMRTTRSEDKKGIATRFFRNQEEFFQILKILLYLPSLLIPSFQDIFQSAIPQRLDVHERLLYEVNHVRYRPY